MIPEDKNLPEEDQGVDVTEPVFINVYTRKTETIDNLKPRVTTMKRTRKKNAKKRNRNAET
jgi:hypothetical protein